MSKTQKTSPQYVMVITDVMRGPIEIDYDAIEVFQCKMKCATEIAQFFNLDNNEKAKIRSWLESEKVYDLELNPCPFIFVTVVTR